MRNEDISRVFEIEEESPSPWTPAMLYSELEISGGKQFVVEDASCNLVGWCCCRLFAPEAELLKIAVARKARRTGVGTLLLAGLSSELRKIGMTRLFLEVRSKNHSAQKFYRAHSFTTVGRRPGYYSGPPDDALLLRKELQQ